MEQKIPTRLVVTAQQFQVPLTPRHLEKYHQGRIYTHTQEELHRHNDRVKRLIPHDQLLVFEVKQGWGPLVNFLGV